MNKEKVVGYINTLQNCDSGKIAKIATENNLYKKAYITVLTESLQGPWGLSLLTFSEVLTNSLQTPYKLLKDSSQTPYKMV
jgi:hypothetical protein